MCLFLIVMFIAVASVTLAIVGTVMCSIMAAMIVIDCVFYSSCALALL